MSAPRSLAVRSGGRAGQSTHATSSAMSFRAQRGILAFPRRRLASHLEPRGFVAALGTTALAALIGLTLACDGAPSIRTAQATDAGEAARRADLERARQDSVVRARPGYIIDSILPVQEEIRRFQTSL